MTEITSPAGLAERRQRLKATGIGLAGVEGAWWLPALEPFTLPGHVAQELSEIGQALFVLFDTVTTLYGTAAGHGGGLTQLLNEQVPAHIPRLMGAGRVESVRPDFQVVVLPGREANGGPRYQLVATELEMCPSTHGFAYAMQMAYGLPVDIIESFAHYLQGRELIFVGAQQWSEFLFEQLAFCRALAEVGARGRVLYDLPLATIAESVRLQQRWQPPMFGLKEKLAGWNDDIMGRIEAHGLQPFVWPDAIDWPEEVGEAVVFRFGYFDCFAPDKLHRLQQWQARGATMLNPTMFILDSKVIMAALGLPVVRQHIAGISANALAVLDRCIPETMLLREESLPRLLADRPDWVVKYAGFDGGGEAWGGRSLQIGAAHTPASWRQVLARCLTLPWPVVAQRVVPSMRVDIAYADAQDQMQYMRGGYTRLRSFILRDQRDNPAGRAVVCGAHLTVSGGSMQVSEASDAVQAPVVFND